MVRMLIVDDERIDRQGVAYLIQKYNFPIETYMADSATGALQVLDSTAIDILFTDICMPDQDGIELIRQAKSRCPLIECIIYSAYGEFEYAQKAMQYGVRHYILKPLKVEKFRDIMQAVLEDYQKREHNLRQEQILRLLLLGEVPEEPCKVDGKMLLIDASAPLFSQEPCLVEERLIEHLHPTLRVNLNEYQTVVFVDHSCDAEITSFVDEVSSQTASVITVVQGGCVTDYEQILSAYSRMETCLDAKFFIRGSCVLEVAGDSNTAESSYQQRLTDIVTYIDRGEKIRALSETELLFDDLEKAGALSSIYVKYLCSNLIHHCTEVCGQLSAEAVSGYVNRLFQCPNIYALKKILLEQMDEILQDSKDEQNAIRRVLEIVEREYMKDISLEQISDRVQLSPSYLSFYFKKQTGQNFIKYLTMYRLEKAKELLSTTDIKVITISEMVGYLNSSYFCHLFKNYTGQTPARFREEGSC